MAKLSNCSRYERTDDLATAVVIAWTSVLESHPAEVGLRVGVTLKEVVVQCLGPGLVV